ncbi:hypothetical protein BN59_01657 [Legionella massiliensis]|uniref:Uncharacterized protein n=1 Tax=Legionella massiliensis TaxID=1034943 RepID=A0A078KZZ1_9GAMM|nr:hypothetical protein [Legionella massiliensis]CDZ77374.1 hypothetical protein BN59_01657 [Legionella massiliensis]CEE13112.1 hypothetical protein BN1094_01657 [Legionella massiliensis]
MFNKTVGKDKGKQESVHQQQSIAVQESSMVSFAEVKSVEEFLRLYPSHSVQYDRYRSYMAMVRAYPFLSGSSAEVISDAKKISDIKPYVSLVRPSYKQQDGNYIGQFTIYYDIEKLQKISDQQLEQHLYGDDDFVIRPEENGREIVKVKMGKLFIEFCPTGKDSYRLSVKEIDRENLRLRSFLNLNLDGQRYPDVAFENLLPIDLGVFYGSRTIAGASSSSQDSKAAFSHAYELKTIFTKLIFNQAITQQDKETFLEHYRQLYMPASVAPAPAEPSHSEESKRDISHFGWNLEDKPLSLFEVSAKISAKALHNLSISEEEIAEILNEYLTQMNLGPDIFNEATKKLILETPLDQGRVALKGLVEDDVEILLDKAIKMVSKDQNISSQPLFASSASQGFFSPSSSSSSSSHSQPQNSQESALMRLIIEQVNNLGCKAGEWFDLGNGLVLGISNDEENRPAIRLGSYEIQVQENGLKIYDTSCKNSLVEDDWLKEGIINTALEDTGLNTLTQPGF